MRRLLSAAAILLSFCAAYPAAKAEPVIYAPVVSAADAEAIALANGVVTIRRLVLDEGVWKIEGRDYAGRYVNMKISRATGAIMDLYRDNWW